MAMRVWQLHCRRYALQHLPNAAFDAGTQDPPFPNAAVPNINDARQLTSMPLVSAQSTASMGTP